MAEPGATAQRPQLSRVVLAHAPRQPGSWLTWDVRQNMKLAHTFVILAAFALAACGRDDGVLFDGKSLFSKTEKGRIEVVLPPSATHGDEVMIGLDRLLEIARTELPNYSARPAAEWELAMLVRQRLAGGSHYFVFQ